MATENTKGVPDFRNAFLVARTWASLFPAEKDHRTIILETGVDEAFGWTQLIFEREHRRILRIPLSGEEFQRTEVGEIEIGGRAGVNSRVGSKREACWEGECPERSLLAADERGAVKRDIDDPPLAGEDATWAEELLKAAGKR